MSRYFKTIDKDKSVAYGYDHMILDPGYFLQIFSHEAEDEENDEGIIVNEGFAFGIGKARMFELLEEHNLLTVIPEEHLMQIALDLPI